jgi:WD40 repeat protein
MLSEMLVLSATVSLLSYTPTFRDSDHTQKLQIEDARDAWADLGKKGESTLSPKSSLSSSLPLRLAAYWQGKFNVDTISGGHSQAVYAVAFSPDGQSLASSSGDRTIKIWNISARKLLHTFRGHTNWVSSVAFSPMPSNPRYKGLGAILASGSGDKTIKLWDLKNGKQMRTLVGHKDWVSSVAFSPNGKILASGSGDRTIKLWNLGNGKLIRTIFDSGGVSAIAFSADGETIASGSFFHSVRLWDLQNGKLLQTFTGHLRPVYAIAFSRDGKTLASGSNDGQIKLWNVSTGELRHTLTAHKKAVTSLTFSPGGKTLASASEDKTIKLWNSQTGKLLRTLADHSAAVTSVTFSPYSEIFASGSKDKTIKIWRKS